MAAHAGTNMTDTGGANYTDVDIKSLPAYQAARWLNHYSPIIAVTVATVANGAALITLIKMKPFSSLSLFVSYLAVTDTLCVVFNFLYTVLTRHDVMLGGAGCKLIVFLINYFTYLANWTVVIMTAERFVAVTFPFKISRWFTMKKSVLYLTVAAVVLFGPPCIVLWLYTELGDTPETRDCGQWPGYEQLSAILSWIDLATFALLPCSILIVLNASIIRSLQKSAKVRRNALVSNQPVRDGLSERSRTKVPHGNLSVMLVTVSVAFVILQLPITIFYIVSQYESPPEEPKPLAVYYLVVNIVHTLNDFNHSFNFIFYFLSGRKFRHKFLQVFSCGKVNLFAQKRKSRTADSVSQALTVSETRTSKLCSLGASSDSLKAVTSADKR